MQLYALVESMFCVYLYHKFWHLGKSHILVGFVDVLINKCYTCAEIITGVDLDFGNFYKVDTILRCIYV